jgi:hypothetical protein
MAKRRKCQWRKERKKINGRREIENGENESRKSIGNVARGISVSAASAGAKYQRQRRRRRGGGSESESVSRKMAASMKNGVAWQWQRKIM